MFSLSNLNRIVYILSNLLVIPATLIPHIDFISNLAFAISFCFLLQKNVFLLITISVILIIKNNSNYRFNLLLKQKGNEISKSDDECVYSYAWCTLLRYLLIGIAINEISRIF